MVFQPEQQLDYKGKYELHYRTAKDIPDDQVIHLKVDPTAIVTLVLSRWRTVQEFRSRLEELPGHNIQATDKLVDYAIAFAHAQSLYRICSERPEELAQVVQDASLLRAKLIRVVQALVDLDIIYVAPDKVPQAAPGHENVISTLLELKAIFEENAEALKGKTPVTQEDLNKASAYASHIQGVLANRSDDRKKSIVEALDTRDRFYTLLYNTYDEIRRGGTYVRWREKDYDELFPSFYATRGASRSKQDDDPQPVATPSVSQNQVQPAVVANSADKPLPGEPGSDPFGDNEK